MSTHHKPNCAGWEDCRCFPSAAERRAIAAESRLAEMTLTVEGLLRVFDRPLMTKRHGTDLVIRQMDALRSLLGTHGGEGERT